MKFYDTFESPFGKLYAIFSGKFLIEITYTRPKLKRGSMPKRFRQELKQFFEGGIRHFKQEVRFEEGTEFERHVWQSITDVPYGETRTYKWLADRVGSPGGSRAVGQALSKNPIPIVVPCHRIIESTGHIGGYSSGVDRKRRLLEMEYYNSMDESEQDD